MGKAIQDDRFIGYVSLSPKDKNIILEKTVKVKDFIKNTPGHFSFFENAPQQTLDSVGLTCLGCTFVFLYGYVSIKNENKKTLIYFLFLSYTYFMY